ncbi:hypothetical protein H310_14846 [Aphanomyces invadans]|uniref:GST N-terminal domain-containing protein n=1 Tax=Aphanomyces invadans TaxID=157072 RepID=A0A024T8P1_9STRA|nr:hypothetical protein H310_14846 [Aphanomyces invadans]ETV90354.1 hypothetical protein H310_14846 [Aphanomyces invadans]|eukprot:XP_008881009.1 hypothetical protein H310_14846 [Aphanomyces invadans]
MACSTDHIPTYPWVDYASLSDEQLDALHKSPNLYLFSNINCPYAQRALWTALEVNAPCRVVEVSLANQPDSYGQKFNRFETVPFLLDNGFPVYESAIVANCLDAKYNNGRLQRKDDVQASTVAQLVIAKFDALPWYQYLRTGDEKAKVEGKENLQVVETIFTVNAKAYSEHGPYLLGADLSSAEINLFPFFYRLEILLGHYRQLDFLADYPTLKAAFDAAKSRKAFQQTIRVPEYHIQQFAPHFNPTP